MWRGWLIERYLCLSWIKWRTLRRNTIIRIRYLRSTIIRNSWRKLKWPKHISCHWKFTRKLRKLRKLRKCWLRAIIGRYRWKIKQIWRWWNIWEIYSISIRWKNNSFWNIYWKCSYIWPVRYLKTRTTIFS